MSAGRHGMATLRDFVDRWFDAVPALCIVLILLILALEALW